MAGKIVSTHNIDGALQSFVVRTSRGAMQFSPDNGHVLPHEHITIDLRRRWEGSGDWFALDGPEEGVLPGNHYQHRVRPQGASRENMVLSDWYLAAKEMRKSFNYGCQLIVDLTVDGLMPQPSVAVMAADLAGLPVVLSVGRYIADALSEEEKSLSAASLATQWISRIKNAPGEAQIGIIGEIGTSANIHPAEKVSLLAAAITQRELGLPINVHLNPYAGQGHTVLDILATGGARLDKVALSHCDGTIDLQLLEALADRGAYVELDLFGMNHDSHVGNNFHADDADRLDAIGHLVNRGYANRILLSQDICLRSKLTYFGGWGYEHLGKTILPKLREVLGSNLTRRISSVNPLELLAVE